MRNLSAILFGPSASLVYSPCMSNTMIFVYFNSLAFSSILATHQLFPEPVLPNIAACRWKNLFPSSIASALESIIKDPIFKRFLVAMSLLRMFMKF